MFTGGTPLPHPVYWNQYFRENFGSVLKVCCCFLKQAQPKIGTHYTDPDTAGNILTLMLEGMSIRAIERFTGVHRDTILRIMNTASAKAKQLLDSTLQNITPKFVQVDEMWTYVHTREPNLHKDDSPEWGSIYLWLALDSETKLIIACLLYTSDAADE